MDDLKAIITIAQNVGVSVMVIGYFLYKDLRFSKDLQSTLTTLIDTVDTLKTMIVMTKGGSKDDD
jgi:hypothetical protein